MSWIAPDSGSTRWLKRIPILIDHRSGGSPNDATADLATLGDTFWDTVRSDGADLRVTKADGVTAIAFERQSWDYAANTGTVEMDNVVYTSAGSWQVVWLYWHHTGTPSDASTSVTPSSAHTGYFLENHAIRGHFIVSAPERKGAAKPRNVIVKPQDDSTFLWVDFGPRLATRIRSDHGSVLMEEIDYIKVDVFRGGSSQVALFNASETRMAGRSLVRIMIIGGTSTQDYVPQITIGTTDSGRIINTRCLLKVQDVAE